MQMGGNEYHRIFHVEHKEESKKDDKNTMGEWIEVALKNNVGKKSQAEKKSIPKQFATVNQFELIRNEHVVNKSSLSGGHNCLGRSATWTGQRASGFKSLGRASEDKMDLTMEMTKNVVKATTTRNPGSEQNGITRNRRKDKPMPDTIYESDSEFEEYLRTGTHFGSSPTNEKVQQETRNFGSRSFGSRPGTEVKKDKEGTKATYAGSNCGHFGSGSSPTGRHLNLLEHNAEDAENMISAVEEGWEQMSILIDSGSTETVAPENALIGYELMSTDWSEMGKGYSAANGTEIHL